MFGLGVEDLCNHVREIQESQLPRNEEPQDAESLKREQIGQLLRAEARAITASESARRGCAFPLKTSLSLCLPVYNEAENIEETLEEAFAVLPECVEDFEVVVVNDGSYDDTGAILARYAKKEPSLRVVTHPRNLGYGAALTSALRAARAELVCFTDSDGQFSLLELPSFLSQLNGHDVVIGYRRKRAEQGLRSWNAWAWNRLIRAVLGVKVRDLDCGFKLFRWETVQRLNLSSRGACISAEILAQCLRNHAKIVEVPVHHYPRVYGAPTGAAFSVIMRAFRELPHLVKDRWLGATPESSGLRPSTALRQTGPNA
jgi:glycosyltransferase involved in cell wall biosynthesis